MGQQKAILMADGCRFSVACLDGFTDESILYVIYTWILLMDEGEENKHQFQRVVVARRVA